MKKGKGEYQALLEHHSRQKIFEVLSDGEWHRYEEIKKHTRLSSATLAKHLKALEKLQLIEKKIDLKSGKYPYPVYYRLSLVTLTPLGLLYKNVLDYRLKFIFLFAKEGEITNYLREVNTALNIELLGFLGEFYSGEHSEEWLRVTLRHFVFEFYVKAVYALKAALEENFPDKEAIKKVIFDAKIQIIHEYFNAISNYLPPELKAKFQQCIEKLEKVSEKPREEREKFLTEVLKEIQKISTTES